MARPLPERTRTPTPPTRTAAVSERLLPAYVLAGCIVLIGIPTAVAIGMSWVDFSEPASIPHPAPNWVTSETVRATTSDGDSIKAKVAIDAGDGDTRAALEANRTQVALLLQISLASHDRQAVQGAEGLRRLSRDMERRLNAFLQGHGVEPVRAVVIQDLLFNKL